MRKKIILFIAALLLFLNIFCWKEVFILIEPQYLKVDFLDVGQGDSVFIQTPEGHKILIDGGPNSAVLAKLNALLPFWDRSLDLVILTHPEKDHMTGILDVLQKYKVDYFLWTGVVKNNAENKKLIALLDEAQNFKQNFLASLTGYAGTKVIAVSDNEKLMTGDISMSIIYPFQNLAGQEIKNTNDSSVVLKLVFGESSFLFTGDISAATEKDIVNSEKYLLSDVLKVAHHGSKYSTSDIFLAEVKPKIAVIPVGAKNTYGHPTSEVLQRLEKFGIKIFRTDKDGDVKMESDGKNIYINNK